MNKTQIVNILLQNSELSITELAKYIGVNRSNIYLWKEGKTTPSVSNLNKLAKCLDKSLIWVSNTDIEISDRSNIDSQISVDLLKHQQQTIIAQNEQIDSQKQKLKSLKSILEQSTLQHQQWDTLQPDFSTEVHIKFKANIKLENILNVKQVYYSTYDPIVEHLGISKKTLEKHINLGKWYKWSQHPLAKLIDEKSLNELRSHVKIFPSVLDTLKLFYGDHFLQFPIIYRFKNKTMITISYNKVHYLKSPIKIITKNQILSAS